MFGPVLGTLGLGERTHWLREGFSRINKLNSSNTPVQYNPVGNEVLISHLYSTRRTAIEDSSCGSAFGGDVEACRKAFPYFATVFKCSRHRAHLGPGQVL
jgi:hypothetical protein